MFESLTPEQRQLLMYGAPVAGVFALVSVFRKPAVAPAVPTATGAPDYTTPSTDAIGTGQLSDFESLITARLQQLGSQITQGQTYPPPTLPPALPPVPNPSPVPHDNAPNPVPPSPAPTGCPQPPAGWPGVAGETILGRLDAPGGGCWWFSNYGGVANMGGAKLLGSASGYRMGPGYENPPRYIVGFQPLGRGYRLISNRNENYDFPD